MSRKPASDKLSIAKARMRLFWIWLALFALYVCAFLLQSLRAGIKPAEASEAAWTVAYILAPVIAAFGSFFLGPQADDNLSQDTDKTVTRDQYFVMLGITFVCHGIVILYFSVFVWLRSFSFPSDAGDSFAGASSLGFKMLMILGTIPVVAVNYLLRRKDISLQAPGAGR